MKCNETNVYDLVHDGYAKGKIFWSGRDHTHIWMEIWRLVRLRRSMLSVFASIMKHRRFGVGIFGAQDWFVIVFPGLFIHGQ